MKKTNNHKQKLIAPSILSADFSRLKEEIQAVEEAGADWIHVDVMDGHFVPNLTLGPVIVQSIRPHTKLTLDVHLMIEKPENYVEAFAQAGSDVITIHQEACPHLNRTIQMIKAFQKKAGVSVNPATSVELLFDVLPEIDLVLIMSVNPGFGGQKFIPSVLNKVKKLSEFRENNKLDFLIEIDGGINDKTAAEASRAGCDVFVAGSAVFGGSDYKKNIEKIRHEI